MIERGGWVMPQGDLAVTLLDGRRVVGRPHEKGRAG